MENHPTYKAWQKDRGDRKPASQKTTQEAENVTEAAPIPVVPSAEGLGNMGDPIGIRYLTRDDLRGMTPEAIAAAKAAGELDMILKSNN